jgi:hypothetical protein
MIKMNFKKAINIVLNEAESSALGECTSEGAEVLEACEVVNQFVRYLPEEFTNDRTPNMIKTKTYTDFCDDAEKMLDFTNLSKEEFLNSYSYIDELEYNATRSKTKEQNEY